MKRYGRLVVLAMTVAALLVPGFGGTASAQDANWCTEAASMGAGSELYGYTVVSSAGGSGSQIVLSDGSGYLAGGSGNDVLCAWGGGNTLDGGSGNDTLIVMSGGGNTLLGGSGNDSLYGLTGDVLDGGSGRNATELPAQDLWISGGLGGLYEYEIDGVVSGTGWTPNSGVSIMVTSFSLNGQSVYGAAFTGTDDAGAFASDVLIEGYSASWFVFCEDVLGAPVTTVTVTVTDLQDVAYSETFENYCSQ